MEGLGVQVRKMKDGDKPLNCMELNFRIKVSFDFKYFEDIVYIL